MNEHQVLNKVFRRSLMVIVPVILSACVLCKWPLAMIAMALMASVVISAPALISLQLFVWLFQRVRFERGFMWMLLLSSIPLLSLTVAWLFAGFVPGKVWLLLPLAMSSAYIGLFSNGPSVSQFFNSTPYEREENSSID